ncbi:MAG: acyloxyacyl hydrolase [Bacteroidia bacterium]
MKKVYFILIFSLVSVSAALAQPGLDELTKDKYVSKFNLQADYLPPTRYNNQIKTVSLHCLFWKKKYVENYVLLSAGLTATYGWGYSEQDKKVGDTLTEIYIYKTAAFGLGPIIQIEPTIVKYKRFSLVGEASGGIILYTNKFPYGGDYYNFMFRMGPSISYEFSKHNYFKIGYRWMHVSNGKGFGNQNPFYEAQGVGIGFVKMF